MSRLCADLQIEVDLQLLIPSTLDSRGVSTCTICKLRPEPLLNQLVAQSASNSSQLNENTNEKHAS